MNKLQPSIIREATLSKWLAILICCGMVLHSVPLLAQALCVGDHAILNGGSVAVPVVIDNATGVASVSLTVNFDPQVLSLDSVTNAGLGQHFSLKYSASDGRVRVVLVAANALFGGRGTLVKLRFHANAGVLPGMSSAITLADRAVGGQFGRDLVWSNALTSCAGSVLVASVTLDSNANGLPDWWEENYFGGRTNADPAADSDGDGVTNFQEFRAGTNPTDSTDYLHLDIRTESGNQIKLSANTVVGRNYRFEYSDDLLSWQQTGPLQVGNGTKAELLDPANGETRARFYRVVILP